MVIDDGEAVDGDARRQGLVASLGNRTAGIVSAIPRHVNDRPAGVEPGFAEQVHPFVDPAADGRAAIEAARGGAQGVGEGGRRGVVADDRPVQHRMDLVVSGELDIRDRDAPVRPAANAGEHARVGERSGVALFLDLEFGVVDAAGDVRDEHERHIHRRVIRRRRGRGGEQEAWQKEPGPARDPSLVMPLHRRGLLPGLFQGELDSVCRAGQARAAGYVVDPQFNAIAVLENLAAQAVAKSRLARGRGIGAV